MNIAGIEVGQDVPCRTVAEISNNHNGDLDQALRLIHAAAEAGADFVKFQAYTPRELVDLRGNGPAPEPWDTWSMFDLYTKAQTPLTWFLTLITECDKLDIPWFASAFGVASVAIVDALGCPAFKLASLDYGKRSLRNLVKATGKPLIQSCPNERAPRNHALSLYCPPGYPQTDPKLSKIRNGYAGYSYHGTDPLVPVLAVTQGAKLVECHIQLDDEPSELEPEVSLTASQFADMVRMIRQAEAVL